MTSTLLVPYVAPHLTPDLTPAGRSLRRRALRPSSPDAPARATLVALALAALTAAGCGADADNDDDLSSESTEETAVASRAGALSARRAPPLPPELAVPSGNRLAFELAAVGVQIYACTAADTGPSWVFQAPEATLFSLCGQKAGTHFAGPTWQANDGSAVVGARVASVVVDATAIPWLLLKAASNTGIGRMTDVSFIQRRDTVGGLAPASGCDDPHAGALARIPYRAKYVFYQPVN